jgi:hypothetical protein
MWLKTSPGLSTVATISMINTFAPPAGFPPQYVLSSIPTTVTNTWTRLSVTGYLLDYPTSDYQIDVRASAASGYLLVDDVQLEEGYLTAFAPAPLEAGIFIDQAVKPANIFYTDEVLQADMVTRNNTSAAATGTLRYEIYDQLNNLISQGTVPQSVPALTTQRVPFSLSTGGKQGYSGC